MRRFMVAICLAMAGGSGMGLAAHPALAASLCVGSKPGCYSTIQAALSAANTGDVIHVGAGTFAGPISITTSVEIIGAGATIIQGGGNGPVVTIGTFLGTSQPTVSITGVTITGGDNTTVLAPFSAQGGGVVVPPPARGSAPATVTITNSVITGNRTEPSVSQPCGPGCSFSGAIGGGIVSYGTMTLTATTLSNNSASVGAAASSTNIFAIGGGIGNAGTLTVHGGTITGNTVSLSTGTAVDVTGIGGGIDSPGTLTIDGTAISGNSITESSTSTDPTSSVFGAGGGVHVNGGQATIRGSQITGNSVSDTGYGGFVGSAGGGIDDDGSLTLLGSTLRNNHTTTTITSTLITPSAFSTGGGMEVDGSATIKDTTLSGNVATSTSPAATFACCFSGTFAIGGGLNVGGGNQPETTVTMTDSTVIGNRAVATSPLGTATAPGGGIANGGILTLRNTTVSNNTAQANGPAPSSFAGGGGIWNIFPPDPSQAHLTLIDSTITHNSLMGSPGIQLRGGGLDSEAGATVTAANTTIALNTPDNCYPPNVIPGCA